MIRKIIRAIIVALLVFNITVLDTSSVSARTAIKSYYLDLDSLNVKVKQYLTSVMVDAETKGVYVNNTYVGNLTSDPQTFTLNTTNYNINLSISLSNLSISATVTPIVTKKYKATFSIDIAENSYYTCTLNESGKTLKSSRNGDVHTFGPFSYEDESFEVKLVQSTGQVYVNDNYQGTLSMTSYPIVFEYIGENFAIKNIYNMYGSLPQFTWLNADGSDNASSTTKVFYNRNFNGVTLKQDYQLSNEYLNLPTITIIYGDTVEEWKRVEGTSTTGTGVWQKTGNRIAVVCEYNENYSISEDCVSAIRSEFPRYYAVYATELPETQKIVSTTQTIETYETRYQNYYYRTSDWKESTVYDSSKVGGTTAYQYAYQTISWSQDGDWTATTPTAYQHSYGYTYQDYKYEYRTKYRQKTKTWGAYGNETTYYISSCSSDSDCDYKTRVEYSDYTSQANSQPSGTYSDSCYTTYKQDYVCGSHYKSCAVSACGVNEYKSCRTSDCGVESYNSCENKACGVKSYKSCQTKACGCSTYNYCQTKDCGCAKKVLGICVSYKSCRTSACGCQIYKNCRTSDCGVESYNSCENKACGVKSYKSCRTSACGVESYKTCQNSACGSEYNYCTIYRCAKNKTTYYQYKYRSWSDWTNYVYDSCTEDTYTQCQSQNQYLYSVRNTSDWSSWNTCTGQKTNTSTTSYKYRYNLGYFKWEETQGTGSKGSATEGWYSGTPKDDFEVDKTVEVAIESSETTSYGDLSMATATDVLSFQSQYARDAAGESYLNKLTKQQQANGYDYVLWADFNKGITNDSTYTDASDYIKKEKQIYSPYLYFYAWRYKTYDQDLPTGSGITKSWEVKEAGDAVTSTGTLLVDEQPISRKTKVIYYDYRDPLTNYKDDLPENWEGYEYLIEEIKNSDLDSHKISVKLSLEDIEKMQEWLDNGGYSKIGNCDMLREFSYIFIDVDAELSSLLNSSESCKIGDDD